MKVLFNEGWCKGCGLCIAFCPQEIIHLAEHLNRKGYRPAQVVDQDKCTSCAACARMCPDTVITVYRPDRKQTAVS
ncbi:2-oxoglutarate ferredoxin oxidoreductase subunit delta [Evansella caseinilytica]|uniref:2-oxoglutarate ferredoxin oxidoreductase subunit delta n=1 Tax=Evansella caseinilytica TaxID=1503961 RepID=A0A1H3NBY4_9BACI|nr:4Fe-4S binding protein [Evansella caseinilytica]SDY85719.1 2-oxoglutarate ferredoxin oxidoreductase subunit delta [Evansella caseinilytica]